MKPLFKKFMPTKFVKTNSDSFVGRKAVIIERVDISHSKGRARLDDVDWIAIPKDKDIIEEGTMVTVLEVDGSKLIVEPAEENGVSTGFVSALKEEN